jgi:hypothetical protein
MKTGGSYRIYPAIDTKQHSQRGGGEGLTFVRNTFAPTGGKGISVHLAVASAPVGVQN